MKKIDPDSTEFKETLDKTIKFTDKVCNQFGWEYNPEAEINEGIQMGLTRNKLLFGKRFCPCFMVETDEAGKSRSVDDRTCPCKPAIETEIPRDGVCHCQIFCTPEFVKNKSNLKDAEEHSHDGKSSIDADEANALLNTSDIDAHNLISLLEARTAGVIDFKLIDVREEMENANGAIDGTDHLMPTSNFYATLEASNVSTNDNVIVYCLSGSRSAYVRKALMDRGFKTVVNLAHGWGGYSMAVR